MSDLSRTPHISNLPRANNGPVFPAKLKVSVEDFRVDETLSFDLTHEGEHVFLQIQKTSLNTEEVAKQISQLAGVKQRDVSFAGMKDRHAITTQWFSVYLPIKKLSEVQAPDWSRLESDGVKLLQQTKHQKKLRRGAIENNRFVITLRDVQGEPRDVEKCLMKISKQGVPNYFGEQRFGRDESNIAKSYDMLAGKFKVKNRNLRSLYLSTPRSLLFNRVLSWRVEQGLWNKVLAGDVMMLAGSHSFFVVDNKDGEIDDVVQRRLDEFDIHPTGPMYGKGDSPVQADAKAVEDDVFQEEPVLCAGLVRAGLEQQRRALRLMVNDLKFEWPEAGVLRLGFSLQSGSYATTVLRECFDFS